MKQLNPLNKAFLFGLAALMVILAFTPVQLAAQWSIGTLNSPNVITFDATVAGVLNGSYAGSGFTTAPAVGQLNSNAWASTGMSDGDLAFAASGTTGDYARGTSSAAGGVTTSGFYAFNAAAIGSIAMGIKPGTSDWTPGTVTLRIQNTTGAEMNSIDIGYNLWVNNSQNRSNSFDFSYSTNNSSYSTVTALNYSSTATANGSGYVVNNKSNTITNLHIANNSYFYLRWSGADVSGSGNWDEFALDDISVTIHTTAVVLLAGPLTTFGAQCQNAGPYGPNSFTITGANLTTANVTVAALSGYTYSTTAGGTYTTSLSLTHPAGNYSQTIYVKFSPTAVLTYNGNIAVGGGGATSVNVAASGSGVNTAPTATTGSASSITVNTATVAGQVNTTGCTAVTAYGIEYSTSNGFTPGTGTQVASGNLSGINFTSALSGLPSCTTYYFRAYATNGGGTTYGSQGTFSTIPTTATVGSDRSMCANTTTTSLGGNTPAAGTGAWSVVSGGTGTFSNAASGSSTFTHTGGAGPITLRWTISNVPCPASFDELVITINPFANPVSQTFNANGNYTVPAGVTQLSIEAWGGGGSGGGANNASGLTARGGAGGGGGAYVTKLLTVTPGSVLNVSVGAAVSGTAAGAGTNGNPTTITGFTGQINATGGSGGAADITGNTPLGGAGGTTAASQGDTKVAGSAGSNGATGLGISSGAGGAGANGGGGGGSAITTGTANGDIGDAPGGGGGGSRTSLTGGNTTGGSGAAGRMIITYTPVADLSATATSICQGSPVTLTASGGGTYLWSPGGATTPSITVSPATTTNYSVVVTNICSGTLNQSITVTPAPSATIAYAGSPYCASAGNANVTLTGTTGGAYSASPAGLTLNSTTGQVTLGSSTPGAYTVTYTIAAAGPCGLFTTTAGITVTATPSATISYTGSPYCQSGGTASVTRTGTTGGTYTAVPAGLSINSASGLVTLASSTPAAYTVTYTVAAAGGCAIFTTTAGITVTATPSATISYTGSPYCQSGGTASVTFTGTTGGTYTAAPAGLSINSASGLVTLASSTPAAYTVTYTVAAAGGCAIFTTTAGITVTATPSATISYTGSPYCQSGGTASVTFTGTTGGTYTAAPAGLSINSASGLVTLASSTPAAYTVTYTVAAAGGCAIFTTTAGITVTATPSATISYTGSPYCQSGGTASVTFTGTTGGTYTAAPAGLSINSASALVTLASSTPAAYTVTYTVAAAGGCSIFTTTAGIIVSAIQTLYADTDGDGYGDPASSITSCVPVAGYVANNTDNCPTLFGLMGDACDDGDANTTNDVITGSCVCAGTNAPWYSQGSGTFSDAIWSHNIGGPGAAQSLNAGSDVVIQAGNAVTITGAQDVHDLSVKATASLGLGAYTITAYGNSVDIDGSLNGGTGTLKLQPTGAATLDGSGTLNLYNLTVDASSGLNCLAAAPIRGTLSLVNGAFTATGAVTLVSTASGTGRLGPVAGGASYIGNMTVQRYIPGGHTNWRFLGSPVAGRTVNDWKDDFFTAGFPGSAYPNFFSPTGSGIFWPSIRYYKETNTYAALDSGIVGVSSNTQALTPGQGFMAWSGDNLNTTNAFTVDVTGAPNIASTPITLPITYTSSGNNAMDGWNLVSNPLPSAIDFDDITRGGDIPDQYWVFNPATGMEQTYSAGIGQGSVNGVIPSSQAFWVKANGSNVTTTVSESAKVSDLTSGVFGGDVQAVRPILRLTIASSINSFSDEATFVFDEGTPGLDPEDALKFTFHTTGAPQVAVQGINGDHMAIEFYGAYTTAISIPVLVKADVTGTYTISAGLAGMQNLSCLTLEDLSNGTITPIDDGASYSFTIDAAADGNIPRFMLHGTMPLPLTVQSPLCGNDQGHAALEVTNGPVDITWTLANGTILASQTGVTDSVVTFPDLGTGNYSVHVSPIGACGELSSDFSIAIPEAIFAQETGNTTTTCPNSEDGSISVDANGGTGELSFVWNDGTIGPDFTGAAGEHQVTVTDTVGCSTMETYTVAAGEGAVAGFTSGAAVVNQPVAFTNTSSNSTSWTWDFGDNNTSNEMDPVHIYTEPGTYTVTLTAEDGTCTDISTQMITVDMSTGITPENTANTCTVYATQKQLVIDHAFGNAPVDVDVYDASGRMALHRDGIVQPGHITISDQELGTAVWFVHVKSGVTERTFRVPLVR